jgi:sortase (surface protein transpeptidase)
VRGPSRGPGPRLPARPPRYLAGLALLLGLAACGGPAPVQHEAAPATTAAGDRPAAGTPAASGLRRPAPRPVRIEIPDIGVAAAVIRLGLNRDGSMQVPADYGLPGWFTGGPAPGETGPAVIAGHIDSRHGPAVFYRLRELRAGDRVTVARADGTAVRFAVDSVVQYPKQAFPTEAVFGPAPEPLLRLITCGGTFDRSRRSYRDNIVVTARLA